MKVKNMLVERKLPIEYIVFLCKRSSKEAWFNVLGNTTLHSAKTLLILSKNYRSFRQFGVLSHVLAD